MLQFKDGRFTDVEELAVIQNRDIVPNAPWDKVLDEAGFEEWHTEGSDYSLMITIYRRYTETPERLEYLIESHNINNYLPTVYCDGESAFMSCLLQFGPLMTASITGSLWSALQMAVEDIGRKHRKQNYDASDLIIEIAETLLSRR